MFSDLPGSVVCCLTLIWGQFHYYLKFFFCSFLSLCFFRYFHSMYETHFIVVLQLWLFCSLFSSSFFFIPLLNFQFEKFLLTYSPAQRIFPQSCPVYSLLPSEGFFISVTGVLISHFAIMGNPGISGLTAQIPKRKPRRKGREEKKKSEAMGISFAVAESSLTWCQN